MEPPHLKLVILQGPREGETLGFEPGKVVRIGRIVRNNTFSIKDAGISSNHLSILVESAKWVLRDLDSFNGTFLNGSKIPPNTPFDLHHGDTVKIGELTSIRVDLLAQEGSCLRRNPRRQATVEENSTVRKKLEEEDDKLQGESSETVVVEPVEKKRCRPRRGRGLKNEVGEESSKVQLQSIDENGEDGSNLKNVVKLEDKDEKLEGESSETVAVEPVERKRGRPRRGLGLKNEVGEESSKVQLQSIDENGEDGSILKNVVKLEDKDEKLERESSETVGVEPVEKKRGRPRRGQGLKNVFGEGSSKVQLQSIDENGEDCSKLKNVVKLEDKDEKLDGESSETVGVEPVEKKRGRPRRGRGLKNVFGEGSSKVQLQSIDENGEDGSKLKNVVKLEDKDEKLGGKNSETVGVEPVEKKRGRPRRGRGLKNYVGEESSKVQLQSIDENGEDGSKLNNVMKLEDKDEKLEGESSETVVVEPVEKERGRPRKGQGLTSEVGEESMKVQLQSVDENVEVGSELKNVVPLQEKMEPPVNKRPTRNSKGNQQQQQSVVGTSSSSIVTNSIDNSGLKCIEEKIVEKKTKRADTRRRKLQEETSLCDQVTISEDMVQEARDNTEANQNAGVTEGFEEDESKKDCCSVKEACSNKGEGEGACSSQRKDSNENVDWPDLEKLTLGEWFNFLEVHLPKQIIDATEEMIDSMKEKAERVRDYIAKQRNDKSTLHVG